jgi:prephenate dehydrogenase
MTNLCIIGLGLMGGSFALALKQRAADQPKAEDTDDAEPAFSGIWRITGVARRAATLEAALAAGAIDSGTTELAEGVRDADAVILAIPVRAILRLLPEVGRHARPGALVLDMGSSKQEICRAMADLPAGLQPVGGHPMCGKEVAGFEAADPNLYQDKVFVLCPLKRTALGSLTKATMLAKAVGARPLRLDPAEHDRAVAAISHLPYAAAVALVNAVDAAADDTAWALAASGFRDTSRVAASDVDMMLDTLLTNRAAVLAWLDAYAAELGYLRAALDERDETALRAQLEQARARRAGQSFSS